MMQRRAQAMEKAMRPLRLRRMLQLRWMRRPIRRRRFAWSWTSRRGERAGAEQS